MGRRAFSEEQHRHNISIKLRDKTNPEGNGCLVWSGRKNAYGYGVIAYGHQEKVLAHRAAYALSNGSPLKFTGVVRHKCDNPACVNPEHLIIGTQADNLRDMLERNRVARGSAKNMSSLTDDAIRAIRADTRPHTRIAADYATTRSNIGAIKRRKTWTHVP